jgi:hypothetical protein
MTISRRKIMVGTAGLAAISLLPAGASGASAAIDVAAAGLFPKLLIDASPEELAELLLANQRQGGRVALEDEAFERAKNQWFARYLFSPDLELPEAQIKVVPPRQRLPDSVRLAVFPQAPVAMFQDPTEPFSEDNLIVCAAEKCVLPPQDPRRNPNWATEDRKEDHIKIYGWSLAMQVYIKACSRLGEHPEGIFLALHSLQSNPSNDWQTNFRYFVSGWNERPTVASENAKKLQKREEKRA